MAQIIDFQSFKGRARSHAAADGGNAEILFFLGVRYERMSEAVTTPTRADGPVRAKRARKRRA